MPTVGSPIACNLICGGLRTNARAVHQSSATTMKVFIMLSKITKHCALHECASCSHHPDTVEVIVSASKQDDIVKCHWRGENMAADTSFCYCNQLVTFVPCQNNISIVCATPDLPGRVVWALAGYLLSVQTCIVPFGMLKDASFQLPARPRTATVAILLPVQATPPVRDFKARRCCPRADCWRSTSAHAQCLRYPCIIGRVAELLTPALLSTARIQAVQMAPLGSQQDSHLATYGLKSCDGAVDCRPQLDCPQKLTCSRPDRMRLSTLPP